MKTLVQQPAFAWLTKIRNRPQHHGPMHAGPVGRGIRGVHLVRQLPNKNTILRHEFALEVRLIRDDVAAAWIDKQDWTIQRQAPHLAAVTIGSLLEFPEILRSKFGIDRFRLRHRRDDEYNCARKGDEMKATRPSRNFWLALR